jgi:hypothetical protein
MVESNLTAEQIQALLDFSVDPPRWKARVSQDTDAGDEAGHVRPSGYRWIKVKGRAYSAHRLVWRAKTGQWPRSELDHINGMKADNRFENLREATRSVNCQNLKSARAHNKSTGVLGVYRRGDKFHANIRYDGKSHHVGVFLTVEQAHEAYLKAKRQYHSGCTI